MTALQKTEESQNNGNNDNSSAPLAPFPEQAIHYPELRYMGSKRRLLPWIYDILSTIEFDSAHDPFSGSGCVSYLMKAMGKRVIATDFLNFSATLSKALVENNHHLINSLEIETLLDDSPNYDRFIENTFSGIFFEPHDLRFLDRICSNINKLEHDNQKALALSALLRSCIKRQPRGVFTVSGDLSKYDDGRRDLRLSIEEHFLEQINVFNGVVFNNGRRNIATQADVFDDRNRKADLVYLDPPYVPRSDDNCYIKRYHFLEGLSCYWRGLEIDYKTKVKKVKKKFTPFSYRRTAIDAFDSMFNRFQNSTIVLSYSSNGYPDLEVLENLLRQYKPHVITHKRPHTYHFGTHTRVRRSKVDEFLIVGS